MSAQSIIQTENFDGVIPTAMPATVSSNTSDWITDNSGVPACTVLGSSGANVLAGAASGSIEEVVFGPFSAAAFSSMMVSWNGYRSTGAPTLSVSFSTNGSSFTNVAFTDVATDDAWHALGTKVSLPVAADGAGTLYIKFQYDMSTGTNGSFIAFDDWVLEGTQSPIYYWNGSGNLDNLLSWSGNTNGIGVPHPVNFTSNNQVFNIVNGTSATLGASWAVSGTSVKIVVGDGSTWNPNFTIPTSFSLAVSGGASLTVSNNATLTLQNTTMPGSGVVTFSTGSTVNYAQSGVVSVIGVTHSNLIISGGANKTQSGNLTINGTLNLIGSNLIAANSSLLFLTLNGTITGSGAIQTSNNSNVNINGTGSLGTITFSSTTAPIICRNLVINRTSSGSLVLGSDLKVNNVYTQTAGSVNLNGKSLTLNGATTFPASAANGSFIGSSSSAVTVSGAGGVTNNFFMTQTSSATKTLKVLNTNRSITLGNALEITDSLKVSGGTFSCGGNLTLKSTSTLKARIAEITGGGSVTGNITVETFIPGSVAGWRNLGSAGISGLSLSNWDGGSGSSSNFAMTCSGCINGVTAAGGTNFVSAQSDPAGNGTYVEMISTDALTPGTGYWIYDANSLTTAINITQTNTGPVVTGNKSSGTGFMSNPYPSPISVDRLKSHTAITSVDVWNGSSYTTYNGGIPSSAVIAMGQGFYANGATNITFQESDKVSFNTFSVLKTTSTNIGSVFQLQVSGANGDIDNTYLRFHGSATTGFDNDLDGYKRFATPGYLGYPGAYSKYTTINTVNSNMDYAINSLPYANNADAVIPVKVKVSATGTYSIIPIDIANLPSGACVTLKDKLLNVTHNLRNGAYVCSINDTTSTARFELTICADITAGINTIVANTNSPLINQDGNGAYVKINFETNTKAIISAYNVMGQKLMADKEIEGKDLTTYLDLGDVHSQVVIIRVTTAKTNTTKKIFIN